MSSRVHILGICGTFMGGVALLARELGYQVSGSDANVYPPMSTMLRNAGIDIVDGYSSEHLNPAPDLVVIGNALSRGNAAVEYVLNEGIPYISGPQWLGELLTNRWVMAISGTHGKTTTSSMLTWILESAGKEPGFLVANAYPIVSLTWILAYPESKEGVKETLRYMLAPEQQAKSDALGYVPLPEDLRLKALAAVETLK